MKKIICYFFMCCFYFSLFSQEREVKTISENVFSTSISPITLLSLLLPNDESGNNISINSIWASISINVGKDEKEGL